MAVIVDLAHRRRQLTRLGARGPAQVMLFLGVRYERESPPTEQERPVAAPAAPKKSRRGPPRAS